jgi:hypothetical protein
MLSQLANQFTILNQKSKIIRRIFSVSKNSRKKWYENERIGVLNSENKQPSLRVLLLAHRTLHHLLRQ